MNIGTITDTRDSSYSGSSEGVLLDGDRQLSESPPISGGGSSGSRGRLHHVHTGSGKHNGRHTSSATNEGTSKRGDGNFEKRATLRGHTAAITDIDWTLSGGKP
jgi:hypothetical protein